MGEVGNLLKNPTFYLKVIQWSLAIAGTTQIQDINMVVTGDINKLAFLLMVYCGYITIIPMVISRSMSAKADKNIEMFWALLGCILWLAAGGSVLDTYITIESKIPKFVKLVASDCDIPEYQYIKQLLPSGIIGVLNGAVFFVEFLITAWSLDEAKKTKVL